MNLEDILEEGVLYSFYGVDGNYFKIGSIIFEAIEDEFDGYRSYLQSVQVVDVNCIFHDKPIVNLFYKKADIIPGTDDECITFVDEAGHTWLEIGTNYGDEYYPYFIFNYSPRTDVTEYSESLHNLDDFDPRRLHTEKLI